MRQKNEGGDEYTKMTRDAEEEVIFGSMHLRFFAKYFTKMQGYIEDEKDSAYGEYLEDVNDVTDLFD